MIVADVEVLRRSVEINFQNHFRLVCLQISRFMNFNPAWIHRDNGLKKRNRINCRNCRIKRYDSTGIY